MGAAIQLAIKQYDALDLLVFVECARPHGSKRFPSLHFQGPGTDLRVGLAFGHLWRGGSEAAKNDVTLLDRLVGGQLDGLHSS